MATTWLLEKQSIMGSRYTELSDRFRDERGYATHVRITVDEYDELQRKIDAYKRGLEDEQRARRRDVENVKAEAARYEQAADANARERIGQVSAMYEAAEAEAERQADLNANLLRIAKERINAKRGLQPKKEHHGYLYSGKITQAKAIAGHDKKTGVVYADVWTATLETPYDGTIPVDLICDRIVNDLTCVDGILAMLGIRYREGDGFDEIWKGTYAEAMAGVNTNAWYGCGSGHNYLFDYKYMVNTKSGLWEVQITTTDSIPVLPELMGKRVKSDGQEKMGSEDVWFDLITPDTQPNKDDDVYTD